MSQHQVLGNSINYPQNIKPFDFQSYQLSQDNIQEYQDIYHNLKASSQHMLGFPENMELDYMEVLAPLLKLHINNYGDPFRQISTWSLEVKEQEKKVLSFYAQLYKLSFEEAWGYIANGSTEAVIYALYLARTLYTDGILYSSAAAHVCVPKAASVLRMQHNVIDADEFGEIDYQSFEASICSNRHKPAIICLTAGTTLTGAIDNLNKILSILKRYQVTDYYIHLDMALMGNVIPFTNLAETFNFQNQIDSLSISGHKFIGSPLTAAVFLTRKEHIQNIKAIEARFVESIDITLSGSRSGLPILCWLLQIQKFGREGFEEMANYSLQLKSYALEKLKEINYPAWSHDQSLIINLAMPPQTVRRYWQLATDEQTAQSHLVILPHITQEQIDLFIEDLKSSLTTINHLSLQLGESYQANIQSVPETETIAGETYKRLYKVRKEVSTISSQIRHMIKQKLTDNVQNRREQNCFEILSVGAGEGDIDVNVAQYLASQLISPQNLYYLAVEPNQQQRKLLQERASNLKKKHDKINFCISEKIFEPSNQCFAVGKKFDAIIMSQVAYYFEDLFGTINYALQQLKSQGDLLIFHQNRAGVLEIREEFLPTVKKLTTAEDLLSVLHKYHQCLEQNGFTIEHQVFEAQFDVSECIKKTTLGIEIMSFCIEKNLDPIEHQQDIEKLASLFRSKALWQVGTGKYLLKEPMSVIKITKQVESEN